MSEEVKELLEELLSYFYEGQEVDEGYPSATVYSNGKYVSGIVSDELQSILIAIAEAKENEE